MPSPCASPSAPSSPAPPISARALASRFASATARSRRPLCHPRRKQRMRPETASPASDTTGLSFEEALAELERIVERLETGTLSLDQSLGEYESGVALSRHCALYL